MSAFIGWAKRIGIFIHERYNPAPVIFLSFLASASIQLGMNFIDKTENSIISFPVLASTFSSFLILLLMRISDEFKDRELDKVLFKDRCLPAGKVHYKDIAILAFIALVFFAVIFALWGNSFLLFALVLIYVFLFYKYFFFPEIISKNLILAFITHNPIVLVLHLYMLSFFTESIWSLDYFLIAIALSMPSGAWEVARKIRVPKDENEYTTYSKVLGFRLATVFPVLELVTMAVIFSWITGNTIVFSLFAALYLGYIVVFQLFPSSKKAGLLQNITEVYILGSVVAFVVLGVMNSGF